ncbi:MAG: PspC domain-containing protein [Flavobacteriales bacterium]|nr:PspC domain-containing protein [Flavobacteriales bacterium]
MKKTVTINISGIAFTIDEDAYEKLSSYLATIRGYFKYSEGQDEIMMDIESRIAEMLSSRVQEGKDVINLEDIDYVISVMGQPEDYIDEEVEEEIESGRKKQKQKQRRQRGPKSARSRLYRDPDRRVLGGVCAGIGHYFGIDPVWLRLLWIVGVLFFGTGFFLYIIFWIAMPEAKTSSEKLEMKGEPVNFDNIGRVVEEEMESVKKKLDDFSEDSKGDIASLGNRAANLIERLIQFIIAVIGLVFKAIGKVLGVFFLFFGVVCLIGLCAIWLGADSVHINNNGISQSWNIYEASNLVFGSSTHKIYALIGASLMIGIPFIALIYGGFKILFNSKKGIPGMGIILTILWVAGLITCGVSAIFLTNDFQNHGVHNEEIELGVTDSLILSCNTDVSGEFHNHKGAGLYYEEDQDIWKLSNTKLNISPSSEEVYVVDFEFHARGGSYKEALSNAKKVKYQYQVLDNEVRLDPFVTIDKNQWRNQRVSIDIKVPKGKYIQLNKGMEMLLYDVDNKHHMLDSDMPGNLWYMNHQGELECVTCNN